MKEDQLKELIKEELLELEQSLLRLNDVNEIRSYLKAATFAATHEANNREIMNLVKILKQTTEPAKRAEIQEEINKRNCETNPKLLRAGDITLVSYGAGIGSETNGVKPSILLSNDKNMWKVVPLGRSPQDNEKDDLVIKNLIIPGRSNGENFYVLFNRMRYVHFRRIIKIKGWDKTINVGTDIVSNIIYKESKMTNINPLHINDSVKAYDCQNETAQIKHEKTLNISISSQETLDNISDMDKLTNSIIDKFKRKNIPGRARY